MKRIFGLFTMISMIAVQLTFTSAGITEDLNQDAEKLKEMGLLSNISQAELEQPLTRLVGLTMILKALGYSEEDARLRSKDCKLNDLTGDSSWGAGWVAIAMEKGITQGLTPTTFGPSVPMTSKEFIAFQLRTLGYSTMDAWKQWSDLALKAGLISESSESGESKITKAQAARILYKALGAQMKDQSKSWACQLIEQGVVDVQIASKLALIEKTTFEIIHVHPIDSKTLAIVCNIAPSQLDHLQFSIRKKDGELVQIESVERAWWTAKDPVIILKLKEGLVNQQSYIALSSNSVNEFTVIENDAIKPTIKTIEAKTGTDLVITFSEYIRLENTHIVIKEISGKLAEIPVTSIKYGDTADVILVTTGTQYNNFKCEVIVSDLYDFANNYINTNIRNYFTYSLENLIEQSAASVRNISAQQVVVTFNRNVDNASALDADHYKIVNQTTPSETIRVTKVELYKSSTKEVLLTLEPFTAAGCLYELNIQNVKTSYGIGLESKVNLLNFAGVAQINGEVISRVTASAKLSTQVILTLEGDNELDANSISKEVIKITKESDQSELTYSIASISGRTITLTTNAQETGVIYKVLLLPGIKDITGTSTSQTYAGLFAGSLIK